MPGMIPERTAIKRPLILGDPEQSLEDAEADEEAAVALGLGHYMLTHGHIHAFVKTYINEDIDEQLATLSNDGVQPMTGEKLISMGLGAGVGLWVAPWYYVISKDKSARASIFDIITLAFIVIAIIIIWIKFLPNTLHRKIQSPFIRGMKLVDEKGIGDLKYHGPITVELLSKRISLEGNGIYKFAILFCSADILGLSILAIKSTIDWNKISHSDGGHVEEILKQLVPTAAVLAAIPVVYKYILVGLNFVMGASQGEREVLDANLREKLRGVWARVLASSRVQDTTLCVTQEELDAIKTMEILLHEVHGTGPREEPNFFFDQNTVRREFCDRLYVRRVVINGTRRIIKMPVS